MGFVSGNSATATFKASCEKTEADGNIRTAPVRDERVGEDVRLHDVYELDDTGHKAGYQPTLVWPNRFEWRDWAEQAREGLWAR